MWQFILTCVCRNDLVTVPLTIFLCVTGASAAEDIVWQLRLQNGRPANCWLGLTRVTQDQQNHFIFNADSRGTKGSWNSCIVVPKGLLKTGEDYVVTLDYEVIERLSEDSFFFVLARSNRLGYGADKSQKWSGEAGARGTVKLRVSATADDFAVAVGIYKEGAIRIQNLRILRGSGWVTIPLQTNSGDHKPTALPSEVQPFTVDPPSNPAGPVLNLADFGAVANGDSPPAQGADKNHDALVAAIAKCRELKASKLIVPKGVYRISSGDTIVFDGLNDFIFDGDGSTFLFHQIKAHAAGVLIKNCTRTVFSHFNLDWDWKIDPLASVGKIVKVAPDSTFFEMRLETTPRLDPKRWEGITPLDEKLRAPGSGKEFGLAVTKIDPIDSKTVRVWHTNPMSPDVGQLYLLRHYTFEKHAIVMASNAHLSLQDVTIFSFPGNGFQTGGDQHHVELLRCRITYPPNEDRSITLTGGGFMLDQSRGGFIKLEDCDFGYLGDDCVDIHDDNTHSGVRRVDDYTLVATHLVPWTCPFSPGDPVEIRNRDFSPAGFTGTVKEVKADYKKSETTLVFQQKLPGHVPSDANLFNHRYGTPDCIIRNCYFHENRARGILFCASGGCLIEGNRFFHNEHAALFLFADTSWGEGFGARNVIVRNNRFESSNSMGAEDGAAVYVEVDINGTPSHYPLLENLLLENNLFQEMTGPAVVATSFRNLIIRSNTIINRETAPIALKMRGAIRAELGNGLYVEQNEWTTQDHFASPSLFYDPDTTSGVVCHGNQLK